MDWLDFELKSQDRDDDKIKYSQKSLVQKCTFLAKTYRLMVCHQGRYGFISVLSLCLFFMLFVRRSCLLSCFHTGQIAALSQNMVIVWRLRGNIIRTALCWVVWHNVHSQQHTNVSSSYMSSRLGLSHWDPYAMHRGGCLELYYCNMVEWSWWDSSFIWKTN